jgi:hypothetical protein
MADKITRLLIPGTLKLYTEVKEVVILFNTFINGRQSGQLKHEQTLGFIKCLTEVFELRLK